MGSTTTIGLTFFFILIGAWSVNLVCYHPQPVDSVNALATINIMVASR